MFEPDGDKLFEAIEKMKDAFNKAASADTAAQDKFQELKELSDNMLGAMENGEKPDLSSLFNNIQETMRIKTEIAKIAQSDAATAEALRELDADQKDALKTMVDAMGLGKITEALKGGNIGDIFKNLGQGGGIGDLLKGLGNGGGGLGDLFKGFGGGQNDNDADAGDDQKPQDKKPGNGKKKGRSHDL